MQRAFEERAFEERMFGGWKPIAVLALCSVPVLFYGLGSYSVVNGDEAFYHYVARHMLESGNPLHLEFTGEPRVYDTMLNAPLRYWLGALSILALGDGYWSMRLGSALAALLSVLMTRRLVAHLAGPRAGFVAAAILLTTYHFVYVHSGRTGELEPAIALCLTSTAYLFIRAHETGRSFILHHVVVLVAMNFKLPIGLLPIGAELAYFALTPSARPRFTDWLRSFVILPLGLLWHLGQLAALGEPAWDVLQKLSGQAAGSHEELGLARTGIASHARFYARVTLLGAYPYALVYPVAIAGLLAARLETPLRNGVRLLLLYSAMIYGFFLVVGKALPWYIDPVYPFLSAAVAIWLGRLGSERRALWVGLGLALLVGLLVAIEVTPGNPVTQRAASTMRGALGWREIAGASGIVVVLGAAAVAAAGLEVLRRFAGPRFVTGSAVGLTVALLAIGAVRVVGPLPELGHVSVMERLRESLDTRRASGAALELPIPVREEGRYAVRYFFGDEFEIVRFHDPQDEAVRYLLVAEGRTSTDPPSLKRWRRERRAASDR